MHNKFREGKKVKILIKLLLIIFVSILCLPNNDLIIDENENIFYKSLYMEKIYNVDIKETKLESGDKIESSSKNVSLNCEGFTFNFEITKYNLAYDSKDYYFVQMDIFWDGEMSQFNRFQDLLIIEFSENILFSKDTVDGSLKMYSSLTMLEQKNKQNMFNSIFESREYKKVEVNNSNRNDYYYSSNYLVIPFVLPKDVKYADIYNPFYKVNNVIYSKFHYSLGIHMENVIGITNDINFRGTYIHETKESKINYCDSNAYLEHTSETVFDYLLVKYQIECDYASKLIKFRQK